MFAVKGTFFDTPEWGKLRARTGYIVVDDSGITEGFYEALPESMQSIEVLDYSGKMICPGLIDLHLHASQYRYCGTAMDVALIEWLNNYAYPEEARFADKEYASIIYSGFTDDLLHSATTRACIFATIHTDSTLELQQQLEDSGLITYTGKLNINRNSPDYYQEVSVADGISETVRWINECRMRSFERALPMITPRFTPSVTDDYMCALGEIAKEYNLPVQSHLSENNDEIAWVQELCPDTEFYAQSYSRYGLFGGSRPTVMAHCIYSGEKELQLIKDNGVFIAHCPTSNENVIAGIAPAAKYLREGYNVGLGSDIAGGHTLNLFAVMTAAVQMSKLYWKFISKDEKPLNIIEAFYMATIGGGRFFGNVGLFEEGYDFDATVLSDSAAKSAIPFTPAERIERYSYMGSGIPEAKFVKGRKVL